MANSVVSSIIDLGQGLQSHEVRLELESGS